MTVTKIAKDATIDMVWSIGGSLSCLAIVIMAGEAGKGTIIEKSILPVFPERRG